VEWNDHRLKYNATQQGSCVDPTGVDPDSPAIPLDNYQFEGKDRIIWMPSTNIVNVVSREYGKSYALVSPSGNVLKVMKTYWVPMLYD
jgi:hypothetical protein